MAKNEIEIKVYKSNKLIEARYSLSLIEQKLILYSASEIDNFTGEGFTLLQMNIVDFFEVAGLEQKSKNHKHIKKVAEGLMSKNIEIQQPNGGWLIMNWVSSCEYKPKEGIIEFEFSQKMRPYLLGLDKHYKGYPLREVMQLNSKYSIRLYELLIQWEHTKHKSLTLNIEELRKKMGVEEGEYERFSNFEERVIRPAVTELNNISNIFVMYSKIKVGRRINEIKFTFKIKYNELSEEEIELMTLRKHGFLDYLDEIKKILNDEDLTFTDRQLYDAYEIANKKLKNLDNIQDYYTDAIGCYMLYYYEFMKDKAHNRAYNYYSKALEEDYANVKILLKLNQDPKTLIYSKS